LKGRKERAAAEKLFLSGTSPAVIARQLDLPLSTVTTWTQVLKTGPAENRRARIRDNAALINSTCAKIVSLFSSYIPETISDDEWDVLENKVDSAIKDIVMNLN